MNQLAWEFAAVVALAAAAVVGAVGVWQGVSIWGIAFRILVSGGLVFFFALVGATLFGRSILQEIARHEVEAKQRDLEAKARQALEAASLQGEGGAAGGGETWAGVSAESTTAESGRQAA